MKVSKIWGATTYKTTKFKLLISLTITGVLSLVLAIITFYGDNTGNFTITTRSDHQRIGLSSSRDQNDDKLVLRFSGVKEIGYLSYEVVVNHYLDDILNTDGRYEGRNFIAYTFYLNNNSDIGSVDLIEYSVNVIEMDEELREHLRVLIVVDEDLQLFSESGIDSSLQFPSANSLAKGNIYNLIDKVRVSIIFFLEVPEDGPSSNNELIEDRVRLKVNMGFEVMRMWTHYLES